MHSLPVWIIDVKLMKLLCLPFVKKDWEYLETHCLYYELCKAFMFREHSCRLRRRTSTLTIRLTRDVLQVWIILVTGYNFIQFSRSLNFTRSEAGWCRTSSKVVICKPLLAVGSFSVLQVVFLLQRHTGYFLIQVFIMCPPNRNRVVEIRNRGSQCHHSLGQHRVHRSNKTKI